MEHKKQSKVIGYDRRNGNVIADVYYSIIKSFYANFLKSFIEESVFPVEFKIAKDITVFKKCENENMKTVDLLLFFWVFPTSWIVLCIIVWMNFLRVTISLMKINLIFK